MDNSVDHNYRFAIYGSFKKSTTQGVLQHGLIDATASENVSPEEDNDIGNPTPSYGGANTPSEKDYVGILEAGIHIPGAEFSKASNNNTTTFVFAKNNDKVYVWTIGELKQSQQLSLGKGIREAAKLAKDNNVKSIADYRNIFKFYSAKDASFSFAQFEEYKVTRNNEKLSVTAL